MAEEVKMMSKDPNPDKLKNKLKIEHEWATKIVDKCDGDPCEEFIKALKALKDPLQIWTKGTVLKNMELSCAAEYFDKARELGYSNDTKPNPMTMVSDTADAPSATMEQRASVTNFPDGTMVISTKDKAIIDKINEILGPGKEKQVFQYAASQELKDTWAWDMFYNAEAPKVDKPEYDNKALIYLINNNHFLKFQYQNLMTGELQKDLDMIWKDYVKGDRVLLDQLKTHENYVGYVEQTAAVKLPFYAGLTEALKVAKVGKEIAVNKYAVAISAVVEGLRSNFETCSPRTKVEWRNIGYNNEIAVLAEKLSSANLGLTELVNNAITEKMTGKFECSPEMCAALYASGAIEESLTLAAGHLWTGTKNATNVFNITLATVIKELASLVKESVQISQDVARLSIEGVKSILADHDHVVLHGDESDDELRQILQINLDEDKIDEIEVITVLGGE